MMCKKTWGNLILPYILLAEGQQGPGLSEKEKKSCHGKDGNTYYVNCASPLISFLFFFFY